MRVLMHRGRAVQLELLSESSRAQITTSVESGRLALLPDNSIAEPVEVFDDETEAHLHREAMRKKHPHEDFRVVLNSDVPL